MFHRNIPLLRQIRGTRTVSQFLVHLQYLRVSEATPHHNCQFLKKMVMRRIPTNIKYALLVDGQTSLNDIVEATNKKKSEFADSNIHVYSIVSDESQFPPQSQNSDTAEIMNILTSRMLEMDFCNKLSCPRRSITLLKESITCRG